ncbi:MAG: hypothetical protein WCG21_06000 [Eubacteriales bacterium]
MITAENLLSYEKPALPRIADTLRPEEIRQLIAWLDEKDDIRYPAFMLLQYRSEHYPDVYPYWDVFIRKLQSENSYQRSIGLMLMAGNARWDTRGLFELSINLYLSFCGDEKPVTVRQCIQGLEKVIPFKRSLLTDITEKLIPFNIMECKETQRKILQMDILRVLIMINLIEKNDRIDSYIEHALNAGILDKKAKKEVEMLLRQQAPSDKATSVQQNP